MENKQKSLTLEDVQKRFEDYYKGQEIENNPTFLPTVMGSYGAALGTGVIAAGGITAGQQGVPAALPIMKAGTAIAAVGAGIATVSQIADEIIYRTENKNDDNAISTQKSSLPFSVRRAEKYKNNEKVAETIVNKPKSTMTEKANTQKGIERNM